RIFFKSELFRVKEERPVFLWINFRNRYRPADCESKIVLAVERRANRLIEIVSGIEDLVAAKIISDPVQRSAATFCIDENRAGCAATVLRTVVRGQNFQLVDRVQARVDDECAFTAVNAGMKHVTSIDAECVVLDTSSVDAKLDTALHSD